MQYPSAIARLLSEAGADLGDEVEVVAADGRAWTGLVMEHHAFSADDVLTLKLASGYNVGVVAQGATIRLRRKLEREVKAEFDAGARGVVVTHGTDTLQFTAAALSFFLSDLPGPVVIVGA